MKDRVAIEGDIIQVNWRNGQPRSKRQCGNGFERCWKKWDEARTVGGTHPLVGGLWRVPRIDLQDVIADSCRFILVLHRRLTLLLGGCEPVQLVTWRYCCLQEHKTDNVRVTLYWGAFVLKLCTGTQPVHKSLVYSTHPPLRLWQTSVQHVFPAQRWTERGSH